MYYILIKKQNKKLYGEKLNNLNSLFNTLKTSPDKNLVKQEKLETFLQFIMNEQLNMVFDGDDEIKIKTMEWLNGMKPFYNSLDFSKIIIHVRAIFCANKIYSIKFKGTTIFFAERNGNK